MSAEASTELGGVDVSLGHERVVLLPQRAAWLPARDALLIADTHWGKSETFRHAGAPIPRGVMAEQLGRLADAIERTAARRVIVVGDLVHAPAGVNDALIETARDWCVAMRRASGLEISLVEGNHDRRVGASRLAALAERAGIRIVGEDHSIGGIHLRHIHDVPGPMPVVGGHWHPAVSLDASQFPTKVPAFWMPSPDALVLPAFSRFTAGGAIWPGSCGWGVFPIADDRVVALWAPPSGSAG